MNKLALVAGFAVTVASSSAMAMGWIPQAEVLRGSDTLLDFITDAIARSDLACDLRYEGGGSDEGEAALVAGKQGIAPLSRPLTEAGIAQAQSKGLQLAERTIGLDGVSLFVKADNTATKISLDVLRSIYGGIDGSGSTAACADAARVHDFAKLEPSSNAGTIHALRRNDESGTTETFKALVGVKAFCADVIVKATTDEIASTTSTDPAALGFAGLSGSRSGANKALEVGATSEGPFFAPSTETIRSFTYPLARRLYVAFVNGGSRRLPTRDERHLLNNLLNPSFRDPLLTRNDFVTCAPEGCP